MSGESKKTNGFHCDGDDQIPREEAYISEKIVKMVAEAQMGNQKVAGCRDHCDDVFGDVEVMWNLCCFYDWNEKKKGLEGWMQTACGWG